jgi:hypothetical protein
VVVDGFKGTRTPRPETTVAAFVVGASTGAELASLLRGSRFALM